MPLQQQVLFIFDVADCVWGSWSADQCSKSCGVGFKILRRKVEEEAVGDGSDCSGEIFSVEECYLQDCGGGGSGHGTVALVLVMIIIIFLLGSVFVFKKKISFSSVFFCRRL